MLLDLECENVPLCVFVVREVKKMASVTSVGELESLF